MMYAHHTFFGPAGVLEETGCDHLADDRRGERRGSPCDNASGAYHEVDSAGAVSMLLGVARRSMKQTRRAADTARRHERPQHDPERSGRRRTSCPTAGQTWASVK